MWKDLTPEQLRELATEMRDTAHDKKADQESIAEEMGFDLVGALRCLARRLDREAGRRERGGGGRLRARIAELEKELREQRERHEEELDKHGAGLGEDR